MFPPQYSDSIHIVLEGLWQSLSRAGENFSGRYAITPTPKAEGERVAFHIGERMPTGSKTFVSAYIKDYLFHAGWLCSKFKWCRNRVEFNCSPAMRRPASRGTDG